MSIIKTNFRDLSPELFKIIEDDAQSPSTLYIEPLTRDMLARREEEIIIPKVNVSKMDKKLKKQARLIKKQSKRIDKLEGTLKTLHAVVEMIDAVIQNMHKPDYFKKNQPKPCKQTTGYSAPLWG